MSWLDRRLKQRLLGALVLIALAVIFLPMLLSREEAHQQVRVEAPAMPEMPEVLLAAPETVDGSGNDEGEVITESNTDADTPAKSSASDTGHLDERGLPVTWSVQLASFSVPANAHALVQELRERGFNAYARTSDKLYRVFVGPVIERSEANRLLRLLERQQGLKGFIVRFEPENH